jgi:Predicted metal-dependent RNase, consists of a metallo-beta-lactamase domain and an RNA-binding KH domain
VPVCLDGMIYEATAIHTSYPEYLNNDLRDLIFHKGINPFLAECFVQVESPKQRTEIVEGPPCVILATSGMLNGGPVIEYLKRLGRMRRIPWSSSAIRQREPLGDGFRRAGKRSRYLWMERPRR